MQINFSHLILWFLVEFNYIINWICFSDLFLNYCVLILIDFNWLRWTEERWRLGLSLPMVIEELILVLIFERLLCLYIYSEFIDHNSYTYRFYHLLDDYMQINHYNLKTKCEWKKFQGHCLWKKRKINNSGEVHVHVKLQR